jgi:hypothetical protein
LVREITSIVVMTAPEDAVSPELFVSDETLAELAKNLASRWDSVVAGREPPAIWEWEPLLDAGVISLAGMVAIIEIRMEDDVAEKLALRTVLRAWWSKASWGVRIRIIWAHQQITYVEEILEPGISEEMEPYGCEDQVRRNLGQAAKGGRQVRALHPHRRRAAAGASHPGLHEAVRHR